MALVYIEYRSRRSTVSAADYVAWFGRETDRVSDGDEAGDQLLYNLARTWRLGPGPEYMMIYYTPNHGLERLDAWQERWGHPTGRIADVARRSNELGTVEVAGCYSPIREPIGGHSGPFYMEAFSSEVDATATLELLQPDDDTTKLLLAAGRIGMLGPDPGALAIWGLPSFSALQRFTDRRPDDALRVHHGAVYATLGSEVL